MYVCHTDQTEATVGNNQSTCVLIKGEMNRVSDEVLLPLNSGHFVSFDTVTLFGVC